MVKHAAHDCIQEFIFWTRLVDPISRPSRIQPLQPCSLVSYSVSHPFHASLWPGPMETAYHPLNTPNCLVPLCLCITGLQVNSHAGIPDHRLRLRSSIAPYIKPYRPCLSHLIPPLGRVDYCFLRLRSYLCWGLYHTVLQLSFS